MAPSTVENFFGTTLNLVPELANVRQNYYPGQPETVSKQKRQKITSISLLLHPSIISQIRCRKIQPQ